MKAPWSPEELKEILKIDSGFRNLLGSFAPSERNFIEKLLASGADIAGILNALPIQVKEITDAFLTAFSETPQKALHLFQQCRFFEARDLLLKTMEIYTFQPITMSGVVNTATDFVAKRVQALTCNLLGDVEWELGNSGKAGSYYQQALNLAEETADVDTIAKAMQGLGVYYWDLADMEKGLSYCQQAVEILSGHEDRWRTMNKALTSLGVIYGEMGQYEKSLDYTEQAVELSTRSGDQKTLPIALCNLAIQYFELADYDHAQESLEKALEIARQEKNLLQETLVLNNLAICHLRNPSSCDGVDLATVYLENALAMSREIGSRSLLALTLGNLGIIHQLAGKVKAAEKALRESAKIYRQIGARACEARALHQLGNHLQEYAGDLEEACRAYQKAIDLVEKIRGGLRRETHRIGYADTAVEPYQMMVETLLRLGKVEEALAYVERAKSRALLEFLSRQLQNGLPAEGDSGAFRQAMQLLGEIEEIRKSIEAIQRQEEKGMEIGGERGVGEAYNELFNPLLDRLTEKEIDFNQACADLNTLEPESASLAMVVPLSTEEIRELLDADTVFLQFFQCDKILYIFVVVHTGPVRVVTVDLSCEEAMEGVWCLLTVLEDTRTLDVRSHEYIREVRQLLSHFHDLLINPLKPYIATYRRIIIAPHLFWHYTPFQALYNREEKGYLCDRYEIGYTPSASVLRLCLGKNRSQRASAAIFVRNNGDLPYVEREGELLAGAFYPAGDLYRGDKAHLGQLQKRKNGSDIIHFACHGQFNHEQPFLSGVDIPPGEGEERRTFLIDFFHQKFDCSLITLSACESGLSRFTTADELLGLSRGLFYAGAAAVLLSLWQVADESTCYLMENFYWHYVKNGRSKSSALQLAMQAVKAQPGYAHPYYWAPFVVMGDWR